MKGILHADFWAEVPAGEVSLGLTERQREAIAVRLLEVARPDGERSAEDRVLLDSLRAKLSVFPSVPLTNEERAVLGSDPQSRLSLISSIDMLMATGGATKRHVKRFYIMKYPLTERQYGSYLRGTSVTMLGGTLDEPAKRTAEILGKPKEISLRRVAAVRSDEALRLCEDLSGRLPRAEEWEKAARGTDGRLYPWGDDWNPDAGFFYYSQNDGTQLEGLGKTVTTYLVGASPYGVYYMAGGLPELVTVENPELPEVETIRWKGRQMYIGLKGCHARESSKDLAWFDHIVALPGRGDWVALRPVLDEWPATQWRGSGAGTET